MALLRSFNLNEQQTTLYKKARSYRNQPTTPKKTERTPGGYCLSDKLTNAVAAFSKSVFRVIANESGLESAFGVTEVRGRSAAGPWNGRVLLEFSDRTRR